MKISAHHIGHKTIRLAAALAVAASAIVSVAAAQNDNIYSPDLTIFDASKGVWYKLSADGCSLTGTKLGRSEDIAVPADFDGDRISDAAVWNTRTGTWSIKLSGTGKMEMIGSQRPENGKQLVPTATDIDGDGKADPTVWDPSTGQWSALASKTGVTTQIGVLGIAGDIPVPADYDGDGISDLAVFRGSENRWIILQTSNGKERTEIFGTAGVDILVPNDYTGDGKADIAVYSDGVWKILNSETGKVEPFVFGSKGDIPVPADYDGDGITDIATYRDGVWYVYDSGKPRFHTIEPGAGPGIPSVAFATRKTVSP